MKCVFLDFGSNKIAPLCVLSVRYTPYVPKGISTNSEPVLRICKKIENSGFFDMYLNQNKMKYMFLNFRSNKVTPLCVLSIRYTIYGPPKVSVPILGRYRDYVKKI